MRCEKCHELYALQYNHRFYCSACDKSGIIKILVHLSERLNDEIDARVHSSTFAQVEQFEKNVIATYQDYIVELEQKLDSMKHTLQIQQQILSQLIKLSKKFDAKIRGVK